MNCNVQFWAADIAKIWHLKFQNVKDSDTAEQIKRSRSGVYEILFKGNNVIAKKAFKSINKKNLSVI